MFAIIHLIKDLRIFFFNFQTNSDFCVNQIINVSQKKNRQNKPRDEYQNIRLETLISATLNSINPLKMKQILRKNRNLSRVLN